MISTRRQFAALMFAGAGAAGLLSAPRVLAQDDDIAAVLNVFISPSGKPFRAPRGAPYPVVDWFKEADRNGDGKIDHGEFLADAEAFFRVLDGNSDGVLGPYEIAVYERRIAPEILGYQYKPTALLTPSGYSARNCGGPNSGRGPAVREACPIFRPRSTRRGLRNLPRPRSCTIWTRPRPALRRSACSTSLSR